MADDFRNVPLMILIQEFNVLQGLSTWHLPLTRIRTVRLISGYKSRVIQDGLWICSSQSNIVLGASNCSVSIFCSKIEFQRTYSGKWMRTPMGKDSMGSSLFFLFHGICCPGSFVFMPLHHHNFGLESGASCSPPAYLTGAFLLHLALARIFVSNGFLA